MKPYQNLTPGLRIDSLTVVQAIAPLRGRSRSLFRCDDCTKTFAANNNKVLTRHIKSCGCRRNNGKLRLKSFAPGERHGFLSQLGLAEPGRSKNGRLQARSKALCDCDRECIVLNASLRIGNTKNCGCRLSQRSINRTYTYVVAQLQHRHRPKLLRRGTSFRLSR